MDSACLRGFLSEIEKIALSKSMTQTAQTRSGRRPLSVDTLLKKDKAGELIKKAYTEGNHLARGEPGKTKSGDVPSRDGAQPGPAKREEGRDHVVTVPVHYDSTQSPPVGPGAYG